MGANYDRRSRLLDLVCVGVCLLVALFQQPTMSTLTKALRTTALKKMALLGHTPTPWSFIAQADARGSYCSACWAMCWVLHDPPRVGGQAVTVFCLAAKVNRVA